MRTITLIVLVLFTALLARAQNSFDTQKKYYFFKTWNWLKYYHPDLATGKVQADSLFLQYLPVIDQAGDNQAFNKILQQFLAALSGPTAGRTLAQKSPAAQKLLTRNKDTMWLTRENFINAAIGHQLRLIYNNRHREDKHYYIPDKPYDTQIPNEPIYAFADSANIPYVYRILALAKIQGVVDYLFPHKYLMDKEWNSTVRHFIPLFTACGTRLEYEKLLLKVTAAFNDTHTWSFYEKMKNRKQIFRNAYYPPFEYQLVDNRVLITGIILEDWCNQAGLKKGDWITAVGGIPVADRIKELAALLSYSNTNALLHRLGNYLNNLLLPADRPVLTISREREGKKEELQVPFVQTGDTASIRRINRYFAARNKGQDQQAAINYLGNDIVYFKINNTYHFIEKVTDERINEVMDSLSALAAQSRAMIFDMRGYPDWGGFIFQLYRRFGKNTRPYGQYFAVNKERVGSYILQGSKEVYYPPGIQPGNKPYQGKVVIIVNGVTLSMSEWNTMALQAWFPQSITIGQQTAGADGDVKTLNLPGNYQLPFTGNAIFYPDGSEAQRKGVRIDRPLQPAASDLLSDRDWLLNKAIELARQQ